MKRIVSLIFAGALLLSATACTSSDAHYRKGMAALEKGDYTAAYTALSASSDKRAAKVLEKLVFVPIEREEYLNSNRQEQLIYTYDDTGLLQEKETVKLNESQITTYTYNEKNQLVQAETTGGFDRTHRIYTYEYNKNGRLHTERSELDGKHMYEKVYTYDKNGYCTSVTDEDTAHTLDYDRKGELLWQQFIWKDTCIREEYTYTPQGLYSQKTVSARILNSDSNESESKETYVYTYETTDGQITQTCTHPDGKQTVIVCRYDVSGNLLSESVTGTNGQTSTTACTYDEKGHLLTKNLPEEEKTLTYSYDEYGNLTNIQTQSGEFSTHTVNYTWELHYYPDGVPKNLKDLCENIAETASVTPKILPEEGMPL